MNITHNLLPFNFAGTPNDIVFTTPTVTTQPYSTFAFTLPSGYLGMEGQGFTLFLAGQSLAFRFFNGAAATDIPLGIVGTDYVEWFLTALLRHPTLSLYCTGHRTGVNSVALRSVVLSDFAVPNIATPIHIQVANYQSAARKTAIAHVIIQDTVIPSKLSIIQDSAQMGLMELIDCEPMVPNPMQPVQVQLPVTLQIRYGAKVNGVTERLRETAMYRFVAGSGNRAVLNPPATSGIYCVAMHDYGRNPVYVHHRQPNWMYLFCAQSVGSAFPFDIGNAVIQFRCLFSDGTMYRVVVDEEMNFSMTQGNVYVFACGLEQMMSLDVIRQNTPQGAVIEKYAFELVSLNRLITYFEQWFFVDQRFLHPLHQTTFLCYDNGAGGFQTAFFSGTVQRTPKTDKSDIRNHRGQPAAIIHETTQTLDISTGYWDDDSQLRRYLRILSSPKVYIVHWQVATVDRVELEPVGVKTSSIALPTDWQASNAFTVQVERLI